MKFYKYYLIAFLSLSSLSYCKKDFLTPENTSVLIREEYVTDLKTLQEYLNGLYYRVTRDFFASQPTIYSELIADNIKPGSFPANFMGPHYEWAQFADGDEQFTNNINSYSLDIYKNIRACNFVIEKADEFMAENSAKSDDMRGQALALRVLLHHWLVNVFAQQYNFTTDASHLGIAYVKVSDYTKMENRQTVAEVYDNMITDLNNAITLLRILHPVRKYVVSRTAAKALLARIYLFKGDFEAAKNVAREVGADVPIMSSANYPGKLFTDQETEAIFQREPNKDAFFAGTHFVSSALRYIATSDIATLLKEYPADKRGAWIKDTSYTYNGIPNASQTLIKKFPRGLVPNISINTSYYLTVLRSSEMYLIASEAYARLNNEDSARYYLNAIRTRANIPNLTNAVSGSALLDSIYKERRKELCFESFRMFDLLRWKQGVNRIDAPLPAARTLPYPSDKAIAPIPLDDVLLGGIPQNPGY